jgi:serralysin
MALFIGTAANDTIVPGQVSGSVIRNPSGAVPSFEDDVILGRGGHDTIAGGGGSDYLSGGDGNDSLNGGLGDDVLEAGAGDDHLEGGGGADFLIGGDGIDTADYHRSLGGITVDLITGTGSGGEAAGDFLFEIENLVGSLFSDLLIGNGLANNIFGDAGNDGISGGSGNDTLGGGAGNDTINGDNGNDVLYGGTGGDTLSGGAGSDTLRGEAGNDTLLGGFGNDVLIGGGGQDDMTGGPGNDVFMFFSVTESLGGLALRDIIVDFNGNGAAVGDRINLANIDANETLAGNQAFTFIGATAFTAPGQLRYTKQPAGSDTGVLEGNVDADLASELVIQLTGAPVLVAADITL